MKNKWAIQLFYLRHLNALKILNWLQLFTSYHFSKWFKSPKIAGMPFSISIEPTTTCNLECPECPSGLRSFTRPTGNLTPDLFQKTIDELSPRLQYLTFYFQGEPFLNRQFLEMVEYASKKKVFTATSTNGHYLSEKMAEKTVQSGLNRLIISIDGTTQEVYEQYRKKGKLEKVLKGVENAVAAKRKFKANHLLIELQFLVVRPNEHQIEAAEDLAQKMGVDTITFKTAQIYDFENGSDLIPTIDKYSRYKETTSGKWAIKNPMKDECWRMWSGCVITWDGKVVPCCFDKDAEHVQGSMGESSFKKIWRGESYQNFRRQIINSRNAIEMCQNCTEGMETA